MQFGKLAIGLLLLVLSTFPHAVLSANPSMTASLRAERNKIGVAKRSTVPIPANEMKAMPSRRGAAQRRTGHRKEVTQLNRRLKRKPALVRRKGRALTAATSQTRTRASHARNAPDLNRMQRTRVLRSKSAFVLDQANSQVIVDKNANEALPIASLTKLMTALVVVEADQDMTEMLEVTRADVDHIKYSRSRLPVGTRISRSDMLHIALMSSENRAASALGRHYPGGLPAFVSAMNAKAKALGMIATRFVEPTGLSSANVASARDLAKLVAAAHAHPLIGRYSTSPKHMVSGGSSALHYVNSNRLVGRSGWNIGLQKTGYIAEAGRCLVMMTTIEQRPVIMVFLDSDSHRARFADARSTRDWIIDASERKTAAQIDRRKNAASKWDAKVSGDVASPTMPVPVDLTRRTSGEARLALLNIG